MSRSSLSKITTDPNNDPGSVLFSLVKGEQLTYPLDINGFENLLNLTFEAVVIEAQNIMNQTAYPVDFKTGGHQDSLTVVVPTYKGEWIAGTSYADDDTVLFNGVYYRLHGGPYTNSTTPDVDTTYWEVSALNRIFIRFPFTLGSNWEVQPNVRANSYGFFELRVTETVGAFPSTWKPVRGMVELLFSPTDVVP